MVISFKIFMELLSRITMSLSTSQPTIGTVVPTGGASSNTVPTGAKTKTAAELIEALNEAKAAKAAASLAAKAAASQVDSQAAKTDASTAVMNAAKSRAAAKHVLFQQRMTEATSAFEAARAAQILQFEDERRKWNTDLREAESELRHCINGTGAYQEYEPAIRYARIEQCFLRLCDDCDDSDQGVASAAKEMKALVSHYQSLLADKSKAHRECVDKEPRHPDVVFKREFEAFFSKNESLSNIVQSLVEGKQVPSTKFVGAGLDPNYLAIIRSAEVFNLDRASDSVSLNVRQMPSYDRSKDKVKAGSTSFHLWFLKKIVFSFIQSRLNPLVDESSDLTLRRLMLNYKYLLPQHISDRDAQISEHSANIQATVDYHLQMKEKRRRRRPQEATAEEFKKFEEMCEKHSRQAAETAAKLAETSEKLNEFFTLKSSEQLVSDLELCGIQSDNCAWGNPSAKTKDLKTFLESHGVVGFPDAIKVLQETGFLDEDLILIPTKRNPQRLAYKFSSKQRAADDSGEVSGEVSDAADAADPADEAVEKKPKKPSKRQLRIIEDAKDFATLKLCINELADAEQNPVLASPKSANPEQGSAQNQSEKEKPHASSSSSSPPFLNQSPFFPTLEQITCFSSENGLKPETVSMLCVMKEVKSFSAMANLEFIKSAKHVEAVIENEEKRKADEVAMKAAEEFKKQAYENKKNTLVERLLQRLSASAEGGASASASAGGGASASASAGGGASASALLSRLRAAALNKKSADPVAVLGEENDE